MGGEILNYPAKDILNQGISIGIEQGIEQGKIETIRKLLIKLSPSEIIALGFSEEEVTLAQE